MEEEQRSATILAASLCVEEPICWYRKEAKDGVGCCGGGRGWAHDVSRLHAIDLRRKEFDDYYRDQFDVGVNWSLRSYLISILSVSTFWCINTSSITYVSSLIYLCSRYIDNQRVYPGEEDHPVGGLLERVPGLLIIYKLDLYLFKFREDFWCLFIQLQMREVQVSHFHVESCSERGGV